VTGFPVPHHIVAFGNRFTARGQFGTAPIFRLRVELLNQRHVAALVHPVLEALHACIDDSAADTAAAVGLAGLHHVRQIVHRVQIHVFSDFTSGSMSRGTAKSTMNMGRCLRCLSARSTAPK
jgi:hypothetical protein